MEKFHLAQCLRYGTWQFSLLIPLTHIHINHGESVIQSWTWWMTGPGRLRAEGPGQSEQLPVFLSLHTIQAIVMTVVPFPQNAQRCVIRGGQHPLGSWGLQAWCRSNYIRLLRRMDL